MTNPDVGEALDQTLTDLINLTLASKQAHWNLVGPGFRSLHLLLDDLAGVAREGADSVAERSMALGRNPDGRVETVARSTVIPPLAAGPLRVDDVIVLFGTALDVVTTRLFESISVTGTDPVTQGILVAIAAQVDKVAWMIRAHHIQ